MQDFVLENTTIWSFPERGAWAKHKGNYRGNWSPKVPRNLILRYSVANDWILDSFLGSGTTAVEAKLLKRNFIGVDVNSIALKLAEENLNFTACSNSKVVLKEADARNLNFIKDSTIDFICTHPPYANIIKYSENLNNDISLLEYEDFIIQIKHVAKELHRVLKPGKFCAIMIGDMRKNGNVIPLGFNLFNIFRSVGFKEKEIIIKEQHNCRMTNFWKNRNKNFLLLAHEYIFVFFK